MHLKCCSVNAFMAPQLHQMHLIPLQMQLLFPQQWKDKSLLILTSTTLHFLIMRTELIETKLEFDVKDDTFNKVRGKK